MPPPSTQTVMFRSAICCSGDVSPYFPLSLLPPPTSHPSAHLSLFHREARCGSPLRAPSQRTDSPRREFRAFGTASAPTAIDTKDLGGNTIIIHGIVALPPCFRTATPLRAGGGCGGGLKRKISRPPLRLVPPLTHRGIWPRPSPSHGLRHPPIYFPPSSRESYPRAEDHLGSRYHRQASKAGTPSTYRCVFFHPSVICLTSHWGRS